MNLSRCILIFIALILNACNFSRTSNLVGKWGGEQCQIPFELTSSGSVYYIGAYSGFNIYEPKYKVEGNDVVIYSDGAMGEPQRFEKKGNVLSTVVGNKEIKCEKQ